MSALQNAFHSVYPGEAREAALRIAQLGRGKAQSAIEAGAAALKARRFYEALNHFDRAVALKPDLAFAHKGRFYSLHSMLRSTESLAALDVAKKFGPLTADDELSEAMVRLTTGDLPLGFRQFEARWKTTPNPLAGFEKAAPAWLGKTPIAGKTILIYAEQGFGDTIQFCRYVPMVQALGANVLVLVPESLRKLMASLPGAPHIISSSETRPQRIDFHCPMMSLPLALGTTLETIPAQVPYLSAPPSELLGSKDRPRIGLCWAGSPTHEPDKQRSIPLKMFAPLFEIDATFVSLAKDIRQSDAAALAESPILDFSQSLETFADTAALISELDVIISADTAVAHLAGALGKPVWILIPYVGCWRWLLNREDCPWYPTSRLFRQSPRDQWAPAIERVGAEIRMVQS